MIIILFIKFINSYKEDMGEYVDKILGCDAVSLSTFYRPYLGSIENGPCYKWIVFLVWFWCLVFQSRAMVMSGPSVHLTTHFPEQLTTSRTYFRFLLTTTLLESGEGRRMVVEIISWSLCSKVWDRAGIKLQAPGSAVRHITDCAMQPGKWIVL